MGNKQSSTTAGAPAAASGAAAGGDVGDFNAGSGGEKVTIDDFDLLKVLGKGSFGKVMLVRHKGTKEHFAMKTLRKQALIQRNQIEHTTTERKIVENFDHPFLCKLHYAFQTTDKLYMVMNYMGGGELFFWLKKDRRFSTVRARLYSAEIILGLKALHDKDIIYRDLKPENLLIDLEGHIRLTDFGLSKEAVAGYSAKGGTNTFCGTPEYLAPEILENKGHGKAVDWWSLGTLMYEMLHGLPPYYDQNMQRMYDKILHANLRFPAYTTAPAKDVLTKLLDRKPTSRLGSTGGTEEIMEHEFFTDLAWDTVLEKGYEPEFKPPSKRDGTDAGNFDLEFTAERPEDSHVRSNMSSTQIEKSNFNDFTYQGGGLADK
jgi:serine/threonine protein kinase